MEDALSLQNFEDLLDPDLLDQSRIYLESGNFSNLKGNDLKWSATCKDGMDEWSQKVVLDAKQRIVKAHCDCDQYQDENWETDPCTHLMAVYYAIQGKPSVSKSAKTATKKNIKEKLKPVKEPKKPKDPAERLLGELDAKEIFEFVRQAISKSKEFKSQFLIHFAEKDSGNDTKFVEIIQNAVTAIKGRKKYMQASDAGKLAASLMPLYKQAVNAEAKGLFREAFNICRALMQELPNVFSILENQSVKLTALFKSNLELMEQIIQNTDLPFEFKNEIYEEIKHSFVNLQKSGNTLGMAEYFHLLLLAAKPSKCHDDIVLVLKSLIIKQDEKQYNPWGLTYQKNIWLMSQTVNIYTKYLNDEKQYIAFLEEHKVYLPVYVQLIEKYAEIGESVKAIFCIEDIKRNLRKYAALGDTQGLETKINTILIEQLEKTGKIKMAIGIAQDLFVNSRYQNFEFYDLEKRLTDPKNWENSVQNHVGKAKKMRFNGWSESDPIIEIYGREEMADELEGYLSKVKDLYVWMKQGRYLLVLKPKSFFAFTKRIIVENLQNNYMNSSEYQKIAAICTMMLGHKAIKEDCFDFIEELRRKHPNKDSLLRAINIVP
jgi:hypothetical protein